MTEYRIDELAQQAGTTVRNVRAYQERGLLSPPRRQGRAGLFDDGHLRLSPRAAHFRSFRPQCRQQRWRC